MLRVSFTGRSELVAPEEVVPGRDTPITGHGPHLVLGTPIIPPFPEGYEQIVVGRAASGARRASLLAGTGRVHDCGRLRPTYEEVCSGRTGHAEVVLAVFDPARTSYDEMLRVFWEGHDPTQGMRQGNDVGTQYRSAGYWHDARQRDAVLSSRDMFQEDLTRAGYGQVTTEIAEAGPFFYAEPYHQQDLAANPNGICGLGGTGVSCPAPAAAASD
ncbi:MAG TPA: peptide-methionine (S)-S-oxide reductase MsrA [Gaiella sp.]|nr:peptide-methionine (S)-S-oxide reductase MsrA [Gaiella sp.]HET9288427.1 peptide-methionine (S)-S-oxide reductase MsrA [Gaiella sp.]